MTTQTKARRINPATGKPITDAELSKLKPAGRVLFENPCPTDSVHSSVNSILHCESCVAFLDALDVEAKQ